mgnify:CR=1 FL=1
MVHGVILLGLITNTFIREAERSLTVLETQEQVDKRMML